MLYYQWHLNNFTVHSNLLILTVSVQKRVSLTLSPLLCSTDYPLCVK